MYWHNDTQTFMDNKFQTDDYKFIHQLARQDESKGLALKQQVQIIDHEEGKIQQTNVAKKAKAETAARIAAVKLIWNKEEIQKLKGNTLKDHLRAFKKAGAPNLDKVNTNTPVARIREGLQEAIDLHKSGAWKSALDPIGEEDPEESGGEEDSEEPGSDMEGDSSEWEDFEE
jgi:hypothetical protein